MNRYDLTKIIGNWLTDQGCHNYVYLDDISCYIGVQNCCIFCTMTNIKVSFYPRDPSIIIELADPEALDKLLQTILN